MRHTYTIVSVGLVTNQHTHLSICPSTLLSSAGCQPHTCQADQKQFSLHPQQRSPSAVSAGKRRCLLQQSSSNRKSSAFLLSNALHLAPRRWSKCCVSKRWLFNFNSLRRDEADHTKMMREWGRARLRERACVRDSLCVSVSVREMREYNVFVVSSLFVFFFLFFLPSS